MLSLLNVELGFGIDSPYLGCVQNLTSKIDLSVNKFLINKNTKLNSDNSIIDNCGRFFE